MIHREPFPLKKLGLWFLFISCGLIAGYMVFVAITSIWVGLDHSQKHGFWMPIIVGTLALTVIFWLFLRLSKFILHRMKEKDTLHI
jgi:uncharacterized membrane protein HdeD (DUF308 family)